MVTGMVSPGGGTIWYSYTCYAVIRLIVMQLGGRSAVCGGLIPSLYPVPCLFSVALLKRRMKMSLLLLLNLIPTSTPMTMISTVPPDQNVSDTSTNKCSQCNDHYTKHNAPGNNNGYPKYQNPNCHATKNKISLTLANLMTVMLITKCQKKIQQSCQ